MELLIHPVEGLGELRFALLELYDVFGDPRKPEVNGFVPLYRKRLKAEVLENLRLADFDKGQIAIELNAFDRHHKKRDPMESFMEFLQEAPDAGATIVRHAYARANEGRELPDLPPGASEEVCWKLLEPFGITPKAPDENGGDAGAAKTASYGDGGTDSPNARAPLTYPAAPMTTVTEPGVVIGGDIGSTPS